MHATDTAQRHLDDGRRPTVAVARALAEHRSTDIDDALDITEALGIDTRVLLIGDALALLVEDAPGTWSGLIPDFDGIPWVPVPASTVLAMGAELLCPHDAADALAG